MRAFYPIAITYFLAVGLGVFGPLIVSPRSVISAPGMDIDRYFYPIRRFVFEHLRQGEFPLWTPHVLGGMPTLGNFQYAMLYPPGWLQLLLPHHTALNSLVGLHVALAGFGAAAWARSRGVGLPGALLAGTIFMFSGPLMSRVYAGHLTFLFVTSWAPLIMLCVDLILDRRRVTAACLGGALAVAMQVVGGYPQPAFYTFMAVVVYVALRLLRASNRLRSIGLVLAMYALGAGLSAAQLLPAFDAGRELLRAGPTPRDFSRSFSLPPENLLTSLAPHLFGDEFGAPYVGRWAAWETSVFIGTVGVALALLAAIGSPAWRDRALAISLVAALLLALGAYTPLYRALLHVVPGLTHFRAPARFGFVATLFASVLAGAGFDLLRGSSRLVRAGVIAAASAGVFAAAALLVRPDVSQCWSHVLSWLAQSAQQWPAPVEPVDSSLVGRSARMAASQLLGAALGLAQVALVLGLMTRWRRWVYVLPVVALAQMWSGSRAWWQSFHPYERAPAEWEAALARLDPGDRVLITDAPRLNLAGQLGLENAAGYDPSVSARWADVVAPLIGVDKWQGTFDARHVTPSPLWSMLRVRSGLPDDPRFQPQPMPRLTLLRNYRVVADAHQSLDAVQQADFDPTSEVILERAPNPSPRDRAAGAGSADQVTLVSRGADWMEIKAELHEPALLLVGDGYASGWRARPLAPGTQESYEVLAANHALRAIPLASGSHHLRHEYRPASVPWGLAISGIAMGIWSITAGASVFLNRSRRRQWPSRGDSAAPPS
jgi:hypothetical protein